MERELNRLVRLAPRGLACRCTPGGLNADGDPKECGETAFVVVSFDGRTDPRPFDQLDGVLDLPQCVKHFVESTQPGDLAQLGFEEGGATISVGADGIRYGFALSHGAHMRMVGERWAIEREARALIALKRPDDAAEFRAALLAKERDDRHLDAVFAKDVDQTRRELIERLGLPASMLNADPNYSSAAEANAALLRLARKEAGFQ